MIFSDFYKGSRSPLAKFRQNHQPLTPVTPGWVGDEHADLLSRDKVKQKTAIKRYLADKVRNDWDFVWPPVQQEPEKNVLEAHEQPVTVEPVIVATAPSTTAVAATPPVESSETQLVQDEAREDDGYQVDDDTDLSDGELAVGDGGGDAESIYSIVSEDPLHFRPRMEWASELSDEETTPVPSSPFRFEDPDAVGTSVQASIQKKRAKRRREVREEATWNEGLACFEARRKAWTGARTVRVRAKPSSPTITSPRSPRRLFFRRSMSSSPPVSASTTSHAQSGEGSAALSDGSSVAKDDDKELCKHQTCDTTPSTPPSVTEYTIETLLPIAQPLLPPNNPLRASITPAIYLSLYDKVIIHNLQPSCPINLSDMLRSCVSGWKRDGEWPPAPALAERAVAAKKKSATGDNVGSVARRMSFGLLGRDKDDESRAGKGIRKSLQRALGLGPSTGTSETAHAPEKKA